MFQATQLSDGVQNYGPDKQSLSNRQEDWMVIMTDSRRARLADERPIL